MDIKKNITVQERVDFVNLVVDTCTVDARHVPALFDYAWRAAVVKYFAPEAWEHLGDQDSICDFVYSADGIDIVNDLDIAEVTSGLYEACQEEIKNRREEYMVVYSNVAHPDPLDRIAEAFEEISSAVGTIVDPETMVEIAKKAGLVGKEDKPGKATRKAVPAKKPIKLEIARKE